MNPALRTRTSQTEQRLKILLAERIRLHHGVNAVRIARTFFGRQEVWPDILVPQLRIAVEYDDPGRSRRAHMGLKEASDLEKDDALREVGWEVIRIRAGGLDGVRAAQRGLRARSRPRSSTRWSRACAGSAATPRSTRSSCGIRRPPERRR